MEDERERDVKKMGIFNIPNTVKTITIINKYKLNFLERQMNGHHSHQHISNSRLDHKKDQSI